MTAKTSRLVIDTNVFVSSVLAPRSIPAQAVARAFLRGQVLLSPSLLRESSEVISCKKLARYINFQERLKLLTYLEDNSSMIWYGHSVVWACRDPKDNKILELALDEAADQIVTGDKDILPIGVFAAIPIRTPAQFLAA